MFRAFLIVIAAHRTFPTARIGKGRARYPKNVPFRPGSLSVTIESGSPRIGPSTPPGSRRSRMTIYDVAMVGIVVAGMVWGAWRGITWQLASIASLVLGYSVAQPMSAQLAPQLQQFGGPVVAPALAMLLIYAAVSGCAFLVAWIVRSTLRQLKFEALDRHLRRMMVALQAPLLPTI